MGSSLVFKCRKCGELIHTVFGNGMTDSAAIDKTLCDPKSDLSKLFDDKRVRTSVLKFIKTHPNARGRMWGYGLDWNSAGDFPFYCERCGTLKNHFYLEILSEAETFLPQYSCEKCGQEMKRVSMRELLSLSEKESGQKLRCPRCGGDEIKLETELYFD
jgi:DNA-directed RNA polymerase subunit RPC12/RpoP